MRIRPGGCCSTPVIAAELSGDQRHLLVEAFKALAEPNRLEIFRLIAAQPAPICVCDIVDRFALSQPTISHHLKVLRKAGLIDVSRQGVWAYYALNTRGVAMVRAVCEDLLPTEEEVLR